MVEDCNDIPIGIVISMSIYAVYIYVASKLVQTYKFDSWIMFIMYFAPLVILYIEIPIILGKSNNWKKHTD